ncbi:MAG: NAD(+)/NADH kinase [Thermodesulfobacteria bacterium]|nr:NAD(+)/NADH kinase [Thermodesulfobacteriota bacterium]
MLKRISLTVKHDSEQAEEIARKVEAFLRLHEVDVSRNGIRPDDEAVVVVGGDGTLLHVAAKAFERDLPLLGINAGGLGFLTEVHTDEMDEALERLVTGSFELDKRMVLAVSVQDEKGGVVRQYTALNEAVITKGALSKIIRINTWADGSFLTTYRGDGLIISTATGSTGYNLSAGGPIIHPKIEVMVLTPICPFALSARPLILSGSSTIKVEVQDIQQEVCLDIDGQTGIELQKGYVITVSRQKGYLKLVKSPHRDYFTILREKLGWTRAIPIP